MLKILSFPFTLLLLCEKIKTLVNFFIKNLSSVQEIYSLRVFYYILLI